MTEYQLRGSARSRCLFSSDQCTDPSWVSQVIRRGMCNVHYMRWLSQGPDFMLPVRDNRVPEWSQPWAPGADLIEKQIALGVERHHVRFLFAAVKRAADRDEVMSMLTRLLALEHKLSHYRRLGGHGVATAGVAGP